MLPSSPNFKWGILATAAALAGIIVLLNSPEAVATPVAQQLVEEADRLVKSEEPFPESVQRAVSLYEQAAALDPENSLIHERIARACLTLGDGVPAQALSWYERGERAGERAVALNDESADGHFYLAANRGNATNLRPFWRVSPTIVADLERHLQRTLAIQPHHARALHMMGILLYRTPAPLRVLLTGTKEQARNYLLQAVKADPNFAHARLDLAELYRDTGQPLEARAQAQAILAMVSPTDGRDWRVKYRPEAEALLKKLAQ